MKAAGRKAFQRNLSTAMYFPMVSSKPSVQFRALWKIAGFEIHDVEGLRPHYALTLREWVKRLENRHEEALKYVTEPVYRIWRLYMAACALQFEEGSTGIYQILASKRESFSNPVPLTRNDLYH